MNRLPIDYTDEGIKRSDEVKKAMAERIKELNVNDLTLEQIARINEILDEPKPWEKAIVIGNKSHNA